MLELRPTLLPCLQYKVWAAHPEGDIWYKVSALSISHHCECRESSRWQICGSCLSVSLMGAWVDGQRNACCCGRR